MPSPFSLDLSKRIITFLIGVTLSAASILFASAVTLTVDEYIDDNEAGNTSGTCNLRETIQAINDGTDIVGDCTGVGDYGAADEIQLSGAFPQTYTLTWDGGGGVAHPLILDKNTIITGPGSGNVIIDVKAYGLKPTASTKQFKDTDPKSETALNIYNPLAKAKVLDGYSSQEGNIILPQRIASRLEALKLVFMTSEKCE